MKILDLDVRTNGIVTRTVNEEKNDFRLVLHAEEDALMERAAVTFAFPFHRSDKLFLNGYQSWTLSREISLFEKENAMKYCPRFLDNKFGFSAYGDGTFYKRSFQKGVHHGYSYAYVRRGEKYFFFGSLAENTGFTRILMNAKKNCITLEKDCAGKRFTGDYTALDFCLEEGSEDEVFDAWFRRLNVKPLTTRKRCGYTSWYNYYHDISEEILLNDLKSLKSAPIKQDFFQIDDGYQQHVGDWLDIDKKKFPNGLEELCEKIRVAQLTPGIWLAPFVTEKNSALFTHHPEWLLKDDAGNYVFGGGNWSGMYALDFYNPAVRDYIKTCIGHYYDMGFRLFKLDFLYAVCMIPQRGKTRGEIMYEAMNFLRETCKDAQILACGVPLLPAFGKAEYCRIGMDMTLSWNDKPYMRLFHAERPSTKHTMLNTIYRRQLSGRAFLNDPDVFLLRDYNTKLSRNQKEALATVNCLFGGLLFVSDDFGRYTKEQKALYQNCIDLQNAENIRIGKTGKTIRIYYTLHHRNHIFEYKL